ncbi:RNA polymerase sigma-70 factor [Pedobacter jeongneungensis]|uniref:RNA polymerase sigma-70 factor n=1 Tax=Pedobacter jeongneungensis TaxID=947309 RepID=UPI00046A7624|nr:RNA polymerase sigma-70 factor [Pedobacter jeongneungensis]
MQQYGQLSEHELIEQLKGGSGSALKEIHRRYYALLYTHVYKRYPYREEVRDIVQELFTWLWDNREALEIREGLTGYLIVSMRNRLFKVYRHHKVHLRYLESIQDHIEHSAEATDQLITNKQLLEQVEQEISSLPPKMRMIFELSRNGELSHKEIAEKLGLSPLTVRTQIRNALRILRVKLGVKILFLII